MGDKMYTEGWGPGRPELPGDAKTHYSSTETKDSIRMKGVFGAGDSPSNMLAMSQASGQNPFEQEEDQMISKNTVLKMIENCMGGLDSSNKLDQSAVFAIGQLKSKVDKL